MGINIRTTKDDVPSNINSIDEIVELIFEHNLISNLNKIIDDIETGLVDIIHNNDNITYTELTGKIKNLFKSQGVTQTSYWIVRGWDDPKEKVSEVQRKRSPWCVEYWINKGRTLDEAKQEISNLQKEYSERSNSVSKKKLRKRSPRCVEYWIDNGYSQAQAKIKVRKFNDNSSKEYYINEYGKKKGLELYKKACNKKGNSGENNPMWGKSPPKGSGNGISGYYKDKYFRSLYEYFAMKYFENNNIKFICNDVSVDKFDEKVRVKYKLDNEEKYYIPDFIVNNDKIVEIKNSYNINTDKTRAKIKFAKEFIENNNNYNSFEILTEEDIDINDNVLLKDYYNGNVIIDDGKLKRFKKKFNL